MIKKSIPASIAVEDLEKRSSKPIFLCTRLPGGTGICVCREVAISPGETMEKGEALWGKLCPSVFCNVAFGNVEEKRRKR